MNSESHAEGALSAPSAMGKTKGDRYDR